jgi:hypothetical protein
MTSAGENLRWRGEAARLTVDQLMADGFTLTSYCLPDRESGVYLNESRLLLGFFPADQCVGKAALNVYGIAVLVPGEILLLEPLRQFG